MRRKSEPQLYQLAPNVEAVARELIRDHHQHIIANNIRIVYLFCTKAEKVRGRECYATIRKVSGINAYLYREAIGEIDEAGDTGDNAFFVMTVWETGWYSVLKEDRQKQALIFHELCHIYSEEVGEEDDEPTIKRKLVPEDLMEFNRVAALYGAWLPDIKQFLQAYRRYENAGGQVSMELSGDEEETVTISSSHLPTSVTLTAKSFDTPTTGETGPRMNLKVAAE